MNDPRKELLSQITEFGDHDFDILEITIEPPFAYPLETPKIKEVVNLLASYNMGIMAHLPWHFHLAYPIQEIQDAYIKHFKECINIAHKLGAHVITIHPEFLPNIGESKKSIISLMEKNLRLLKTTCTEYSMQLNFENFISSTYSIQEVKDIIADVDLDITFDIGHSNVYYGTKGIFDFFSQFEKKITHIHVHDNFGDKDSHLPIGTGSIEWDLIIKRIKPFYDSTFTIEVHSQNREYLWESRRHFVSIWTKSN